MDFKLTINCDNDTFWQPEREVKRILEKVTKQVNTAFKEGKIYDYNGNNVGKWKFTDI